MLHLIKKLGQREVLFNFLRIKGKMHLHEYLIVFTATLLFLKVFKLLLVRRRKQQSEKAERLKYTGYHCLPGPKPSLIPYLGNGLLFVNKFDIFKKFCELSRQYGPCYKLNFLNEDYVVLNSAPFVQAILMSNDIGHIRRGAMEELIFPQGLEGLIIYHGEKWKTRRKMLTRSFTYRALQRYNVCFNQHSENLVHELEQLFSDGKVHTIESLVKICVCRQSSATLMGVDLSNTEDGVMFCEGTDTIMNVTFERVYQPWLFIPWLWRLHPLSRKYNKAIEDMSKITEKVIREYKERNPKEESLIHQNDDKDEGMDKPKEFDNMIEVMLYHGVDERKILDEIALLLAVAYDTTSVSVEFALFLLALSPEHQQLCRDEIDRVYNDPLKNKNGILDFDALSELKLLERCILEAQRIYPLATTMRRLESPLRLSDDLVIPSGVSVFVLAYVLHMNPEYFPNPEKFDPDRFLPEKVKQRHPNSYMAFSAGPRNCIGMKLAIIELKVVIAKILRNFEVSTSDTRETVKIVLTGITKPTKPINFIFKKRKL